MIFGSSILLSIYATALVAGLAYQQVEPILKFAPSAAKFAKELMEAGARYWNRLTMPEDRKRMEKAATFLQQHQALVQWSLRKLAIRLVLAWMILALSLVAVFLLVGILLERGYTVNEAGPVQIAAVGLPLFGILVALLLIWWYSRRTQTQAGGEMPMTRTGPDGEIANLWKAVGALGQELQHDLADLYHMSSSLSAFSHAERSFIRTYFTTLAWLRKMEALLAVRDWKGLELDTDSPDRLMKEAQDLWQEHEYDKAFDYYIEVYHMLGADRTLSDEQLSEALLHQRLGGCYARNGDVMRAIQEFRKAAELDPEVARAVCRDPFEIVVKPIKSTPEFKRFCQRVLKEEEE